MSSRRQNEKKYGNWTELAAGGRRYNASYLGDMAGIQSIAKKLIPKRLQFGFGRKFSMKRDA
jgi:hypothetical protein